MGPKRVDFAEFYASSRDDCLRTVLAITGDPATAEDVVAEAFARAWASWRTVSRHPAPRAWVVRTALNLRTSYWRRHRREVPGGEDAWRAVAGATARPGPDPVDPEIMAALAGLPERQRQVVVLRVFLDLGTADTARALGIAPGTVTAHLARAVSALRIQLSPRLFQGRQR
jgi:RNA polymerase sigma-70 factor (sigma-E family)